MTLTPESSPNLIQPNFALAYDSAGNVGTITHSVVGGTFYSNDVLSETRHPDKSTGSASSSEKDTFGHNTLGELVTATDRNGTVHTYAHDVLGRLTSDTATTLGTGIDGAVRRLETSYDTLGQPLSLTSYSATTGGSIVNQVVRSYNGLSQVTAEYQSHSGAVNTSTTPKVQYAYSEMSGGANHSRLTQLVYPQGATVNFGYGSGVDSAISRITSAEMLSTGNATLSSDSYSYLGLATVVEKTTPVATLSYIQHSGDTAANTDAGDQYTGLDRFGRVIDQVWRSGSGSGTIMDRYQYGYDRYGNRLFKNNLLDSALSELYGYDNLNQLTDFARGVLSDTNSDGMLDTVASPSRTQNWSLDALGNWSNLTTNGTGQSRTHNAQNQVTGVGSASLTYDSNGSMTADESGRVFVYDAWNRLVSVRNTANSPIVEYELDALSRRIIEDRPNANTVDHLYYSTGWQVLEERRDGTSSGDVRKQYFWSVDYVDALTARVDYASGAVSATYHAQYDANWNITAIADASTGVLERYIYDPYGEATVLYANWTVGGGSPYGWNYLHQGGRLDVDTNLYNFRHRDYSASIGRWTSEDPLGFSSGDENFYRYLFNSPVNALDPSGLQDGRQPYPVRPPVPGSGFPYRMHDSPSPKPAPPFIPIIEPPRGWHPPMALIDTDILYIYDGNDPGFGIIGANGNSFLGVVRGRGGDTLNMGGCSGIGDFSKIVELINQEVKGRGKPYKWIVWEDHGGVIRGQHYGETSLYDMLYRSPIYDYQGNLIYGEDGKPVYLPISITLPIVSALLSQLGDAVDRGFRNWGCQSGNSSMTQTFAELTGKPVSGNTSDSIHLSWGPYWPGYKGPKWHYPKVPK